MFAILFQVIPGRPEVRETVFGRLNIANKEDSDKAISYNLQGDLITDRIMSVIRLKT